MNTPERTTHYVGSLTDTARWDQYIHRTDDIFICTPPKCGTTWTQAICAHLVFGTEGFSGKLADISPWFDSALDSLEDCVKTLAAQAHRRFVKTHTPLDGVPYFPSSQYLVVYRDPRDAYLSYRNHMMNMLSPPDIPQLDPDPSVGFRAWLDQEYQVGVSEQRSLEAFVHHYLSYAQFRHLENLHFFHYGDMLAELPKAIHRFADVLQLPVTDDRCEEIAHGVSFSEMKKDAETFAPGAGKNFFKSDTAFFSKGESAQWKDVLDASVQAHYEERMRELLSEADVAWLEYGDLGVQ